MERRHREGAEKIGPSSEVSMRNSIVMCMCVLMRYLCSNLMYLCLSLRYRDGAALIAENEALLRSKGSAVRVLKSTVGKFIYPELLLMLLLYNTIANPLCDVCMAVRSEAGAHQGA